MKGSLFWAVARGAAMIAVLTLNAKAEPDALAPVAAIAETTPEDLAAVGRVKPRKPAKQTTRAPKKHPDGTTVARRAGGYALPRHLDQALGVDAIGKTLLAQRTASFARYATVDALAAGSPYIAGNFRGLGGGSERNFLDGASRSMRVREGEIEAGMPMWLPGQRDALRSTVSQTTQEFEARFVMRRWEVAGLVREAWWTAQRTAREAEIARARLESARDLLSDMEKRNRLGESAGLEALAARNETLAAETELSQMTAAAQAARAAYETLTAGGRPDGVLETISGRDELDGHPALMAPLASLLRAEAQLKLVDATPIDNPELGLFGRREVVNQGDSRAENTTMGLRFRMPLPTDGRNSPRKAEAQAEITKAFAELHSARRLVAAEIRAARLALEGARRSDGLAGERLKVANEQYELARKSFRLGESDAAEVFRSRQLLTEAEKVKASTSIGVGAAASRLNQARGIAPGV